MVMSELKFVVSATVILSTGKAKFAAIVVGCVESATTPELLVKFSGTRV